jgi:hypothetical protein
MKMKRIAFYGAATVVIAVLIAMLIPVPNGHKPTPKNRCQAELSDLAFALKSYHDTFNVYPAEDNSNIVRALVGGNLQKIVFLNFRRTTEHPNEIVDSWGTPYRITFLQQTNFVLRSAGKNKIFSDEDDIIFNSASNDFVKP